LALWIWKKLFDRVTREVIRWVMPKLGVEEWLIAAVMSMYTGAKTVVRTVCGSSECFEVKVGMHQGLALCFQKHAYKPKPDSCGRCLLWIEQQKFSVTEQ